MRKPYYQDEWATIYHGDCREILPDLPKVDVVLTDPPYNVGKDYEGGPDSWQDNLPEDEYWSIYREWLVRIHGSLNERTYLYISSTSKQMFTIKSMAEEIGFTWLQVLIWYGPNTVGGTSYAMPWMQMFEPISLFSKGKRRKMLNGGLETNTHDVFVVPRPQRNFDGGRFHVAQKPIKLYRRLIARTPGAVVLDPFMGSGTTLVAAKYHNRRCIGIDVEEKYCEIAAKRCCQGVFDLT